MTFTITVPFWTMLPLALCLAVLAAGLWIDLAAIGSALDYDCSLIAIVLCLVCWVLVLYGRYEPWLVLPVLVTTILIFQAWRERLKREARRIVASILVAAWLLVVYGRLTA
ncbi:MULTISPECIES: hypothetical protein [unclassified Polaromonas]|jgi:hypothetical protein|uniref:hypothetical protein n=1 Tax=unclassified Polaromonas TaxID=2638319 RepID=UPI000BD6BA14|nr:MULTISPECIES: hypothetical protein [unclassified Polaromonas]OYY37066.1 MAG: hypothetical protein B7Y60_08830 [Polaromonas sp. 35-63-35]OYZ13600.1 MAG: hypothetical protein B7Y28_23505 [Polaromonas sp. 16-63-31]OYZ78823.1 MAG: hypothetical protein B7Y09_11095 [Polaromonas sp. 24-63-21]OZA49663.1 MAG: hypothetical protein B7X88_14735 [Polaromonas sp. 17-63-33]OZA86793.1 MAG: hypothetical protein B7X65_15085 [Polaromonas sp. 39-63-25]